MRTLRLIAILLVVTTATFAQDPLIMRGHAHNDYKHKRPLLDALDNGFFSVEADVYLRHGDLKVAHTPFEIKKENNLKNLYLEPLKQRIQQNGGRVYANGPLEFVLMIDLKQGGGKMMRAIKQQLADYKDLLTVYEHGVKKPGAIRIILSGKQNVAYYQTDEPRYISGDDDLLDINAAVDSSVEPRASANYHDIFTWGGGKSMSPIEAKRLADIMRDAHEHGRKARFYHTPEREDVWQTLLDAGQDWISVDDLERFRKFYLEYMVGK